MPRILSNEPCRVTFEDNIAGGNITVLYRLPTTEERIKYANSNVSRHGRKVESILGDTRMKFGRKIFVGITDGDFVKADGTPLSSNPKSPNYDETWKTIIETHAPDVISMLAVHVFENALTLGDGSDEKEVEDPS
jgi:hypothetical protein